MSGTHEDNEAFVDSSLLIDEVIVEQAQVYSIYYTVL